jgi:hypothetical protein
MIPEITKLVSLILGISVASDRLITLIKSIWPTLAAPPGSAAPGPPSGEERKNRVILITISFGCCLISTELLYLSVKQFPFINPQWAQLQLCLIALLATGGSSFWTNILGYLSALKDATNVKAFASKDQTEEHAISVIRTKRRQPAQALTTVTFAAAFSGGPGTMAIEFATGESLDFDSDGTKTLQLPEGENDFTVSGAASPGPGGGAVLTITGTQVVKPPIKFGAGRIRVKTYSLIV